MLSNLIVPKARRPKFDLTLRIIDLNNVPLVTGTALIKYSLPSSSTTSGEHTGRTERCPITEHKVQFDYTRTFAVRLTIDKNNNLSECLIHFEILQEFHSGAVTKAERVPLGHVVLNLAEYVEESEQVDGEEGVVRRYLLQDSKINSTLKIGVFMKQVDGERNFVAPPLKTAAVFGGIAGIMVGEREGVDETVGQTHPSDLPNLNQSRDHSELHDIYRRSLAASWAAQAGELPADQCVEDIFNGGDGWQGHHSHRHGLDLDDHDHDTYPSTSSSSISNLASENHTHNRHHSHSHTRTKSRQTMRSSSAKLGTPATHVRKHKHNASQETLLARKGESESSLAMGLSSSSVHGSEEGGDAHHDNQRGRTGLVTAREVDEFAVRDDLVAWRLPGTVSS
ncbi:Uncharacterized protein LCER1_G008007 [Lachnellula cervina]|uniref:C2 NT-type domain-containing protein n=1 Tax=Lachnellula cervina TaxID=1316786 RepID=A0A7D8YQB6_9HELO|nr:Uncharacterized protein LCER1_G008007 [Lachnellula cervina]